MGGLSGEVTDVTGQNRVRCGGKFFNHREHRGVTGYTGEKRRKFCCRFWSCIFYLALVLLLY